MLMHRFVVRFTLECRFLTSNLSSLFMQLKQVFFCFFRLLDIIDAYEKQVLGLQKQIEFYK